MYVLGMDVLGMDVLGMDVHKVFPAKFLHCFFTKCPVEIYMCT